MSRSETTSPIPDATTATVPPAVEAGVEPGVEPSRPVREYHHALRADGVRWWRGALAIVCLLVGYLVINTALSIGAVMIDVANGTRTESAGSAISLTPLTLLAVNLSAAAMIPLGGLLQWAFFGVRPRWLSSVTGGFRWSVLRRAAVVVVPVFVVYVVGFSALALLVTDATATLAVSVPLLVVVLATTWAQAAGEEYGYRGLITRSVGSWFANPRTALLVALPVANLLFMVAHVAQDPWLIVYYFVFGLAASVISWRTGGLEVAILMHATNNVLLFVWTALTSGGGAITIDRSVGAGGPVMLIPMAVLALTAAGITWWSARTKITRVAPAPR